MIDRSIKRQTSNFVHTRSDRSNERKNLSKVKLCERESNFWQCLCFIFVSSFPFFFFCLGKYYERFPSIRRQWTGEASSARAD